jgi:hypothetical protein
MSGPMTIFSSLGRESGGEITWLSTFGKATLPPAEENNLVRINEIKHAIISAFPIRRAN